MLRWGFVALFLCHAAIAAGQDEQRQVLEYCENFARHAPEKLSAAPTARYVPQSAVVKQRIRDRITTVVSNFFQPRDSRFLRAWNCRFRVTLEGKTCAGKVSLPVVEHKDFADYTQWPELMIVPDNRITDAAGTAVGYLTPKYYELNCAAGDVPQIYE